MPASISRDEWRKVKVILITSMYAYLYAVWGSAYMYSFHSSCMEGTHIRMLRILSQ